jgi:hypothetical protein
MAPRVGHLVIIMLIIVPFHELHALVPETQVIPIRSGVATGHVADGTVIENLHTVETVNGLADVVPGR